jgi:hypothetical protein
MDWEDALKKIAPTVATVIGGPFAGMAIEALGKALGKDPKDVPSLLATGQMNGDQLAAIRKAELDLQAQLEANGVQLEQIAASDRDSARKRQMALGDKTTPILAWIVVVASIALGALIVTGTVTSNAADATLVGTVVGYVFSEAKQVLAYYFGSSMGSDKKTDLLAKAPSIQ